MPELWKAGKTKDGFPPLPTAPWESRQQREIPTFPQSEQSADGKMENQKQVSHFFHARFAMMMSGSIITKTKHKKGTF